MNRPLMGESDSGASEVSVEGSYAHLAFEWALLDGGFEILEHVTTLSMEEDLIPLLEWTWNQPGVIHEEDSLDYGQAFGYVGLTGTSDIVIEDPACLTVADLKYGRGVVEVESEKDGFNPQLMIYLVGAVEKYGPREAYRLVILQPRAHHPDGPIREVYLSHLALVEFKVHLLKALEANYLKGSLVAGDHCRKWCRALAICPAVKEQAISIFRSTPL